jgi:hypothetical protein
MARHARPAWRRWRSRGGDVAEINLGYGAEFPLTDQWLRGSVAEMAEIILAYRTFAKRSGEAFKMSIREIYLRHLRHIENNI